MMHVGLVLAKTPAYTETFFLSKIKGLQAHGIAVTLFVQDQNPDFTLCPVRVAPKVYKRNPIRQTLLFIVVLCKALWFYKRFQQFMRLEKRAGRSLKQRLKNGYTNSHMLTVHMDWLHFGFATLAIQSEHVAKAIGAKMAVSFRGFDLDVYPLKHPGCYDLVWKHIDKVHSISTYLLQKAYVLGLSRTVPHEVITPAVDLSLMEYKPKARKGPVVFATVARLHWIKGLQATLEALALLKTKQVDFKYFIIGDGYEYESLMFAVHQLGLTGQVSLIGKQSHNNTLKTLEKADIYIQYSYSEGFCNAVLEAQAMGLLCVVSDGGGLSENVIDGKTGWLAEKGKPIKLAETLEEVIHLPKDLKNKVRNQARTRVRSEFHLEKQNIEFWKFFS